MASICTLRIMMLSCGIFIFLCGILVNFEDPLNYRYVVQLSKLKLNYVFGSSLQVNDSEGKRINDSEKAGGDRDCDKCTYRGMLNPITAPPTVTPAQIRVKPGAFLGTYEHTNNDGQSGAELLVPAAKEFHRVFEDLQGDCIVSHSMGHSPHEKNGLPTCSSFIYKQAQCYDINWMNAVAALVDDTIKRQTEEDVIKIVTQLQQCQWHKQELAAENFRLELKRCCHAASNCLVTQKNTPVGTELTYDAEPKQKIKVTHPIFTIFPKDSSFSSRQYRRCAVIGNGGILVNSSCGAEIDQADFVFRCNLPPVGGDFAQDIGTKTNLVTANPSIIAERYAELHDRRKPFFTNLTIYNEAFLLLPAFSYTKNTVLCFRALYTLQDFQAKQKVVFFNPVYLKHLTEFWLSKGIQVNRLSTGIMVVSVAIELCEEVWIYGFWPFGKNVEGKVVAHHYFDNLLPKPDVHSMPSEFHQLIQLHSKGIIKLKTAQCQADPEKMGNI